MSLEDVGALGGLVFLILFILLCLFVLFYHSRKRVVYAGEQPDHISMYFDETMDSIINEYDIVLRKPFSEWKKVTGKRIAAVEKSVGDIGEQRKKIDLRLSDIENEVAKLR